MSLLTLPWLVCASAAQVTMSRPGSSWSSVPVTETFLPVLSRTQTPAPAKGYHQHLHDLVHELYPSWGE